MLDATETETAYRAIGLGSRFARPRPRKPTRGEQASKSNIPFLLQYIKPKVRLWRIFVLWHHLEQHRNTQMKNITLPGASCI